MREDCHAMDAAGILYRGIRGRAPAGLPVECRDVPEAIDGRVALQLLKCFPEALCLLARQAVDVIAHAPDVFRCIPVVV